jgi:catechol 2,3-dioxygenase-like lactoylglutathione lyase family enzyme
LNTFTAANPTQHFHHGLYEVHLPVTNLQRSIDFYTSKLGFELGWSTPGGSSALLFYDDEGARWMLGLFWVETVVHRSPAEYHISFRVAEAQADTMVAWLRARGIEPFHPPHAPIQGTVDEPIVHGCMPAAAVFFKDPDGHLLELIADLSDAPRPDFLYRPLSEWRALVSKKA